MDRCFNDEVGHAFYCKMLERDLSKYNSQKFPPTKARVEAETNRLDPLFRIIKFHFLFPKKNIHMTVQQLHDQISRLNEGEKEITRVAMTKKLREVGIDYKKSNDKNWYHITNEELISVAEKFKWFNEYDKEEYEKMNKDEAKYNQYTDKDEDDYKEALKKANEQNEQLKAEIEELKKQLQQQNSKTDEPDEVEEPEEPEDLQQTYEKFRNRVKDPSDHKFSHFSQIEI